MINTFLYTLKLFFTSIAFLSWIPIPHWMTTDKDLHKMGIFFPLAGAFLGCTAAIVFIVSNLLFPYSVSVAITLLAYGWITGMFHEDALADAADGMGGCGAQNILEIMRDSSIGTYGSFALISSYILRFTALTSVAPDLAVLNIIAYAAASRMAGVIFLTLAQEKDIPPESLSRTVSFSNQWLCCILGLCLLTGVIYFVSPMNIPLIAGLILLIPILARRYFLRRFGFINGDCAGVVIHLTETTLYVLAAAS